MTELESFTAMLTRARVAHRQRDGTGRDAGLITIEVECHRVEGFATAEFVFTRAGELKYAPRVESDRDHS